MDIYTNNNNGLVFIQKFLRNVSKHCRFNKPETLLQFSDLKPKKYLYPEYKIIKINSGSLSRPETIRKKSYLSQIDAIGNRTPDLTQLAPTVLNE